MMHGTDVQTNKWMMHGTDVQTNKWMMHGTDVQTNKWMMCNEAELYTVHSESIQTP
jgi:hypothetical protein